ncbi:MAG: TonB-dependent receptor [Ignavibacteriae bacterium]|nr:TonB-dependent receptor [Ignavibacteriota bacterium]
MKYFFLITFTTILSCITNAQIVTVRDSESNLKLESVIIKSEKPKAITSTNSVGEADLDSFKESKKIIFQHLGYETLEKSFSELEKENFILFMKPTNISLDQIVVSATRWNQAKNEIASKIINISPKDIELQNPQTTADLLNSTGQVFIQKSQQGGGSPMIRGFATNRLLISVDGIRMNTAIFRSGNLQNVISLDNFSLQNVEVMFGPGSVIYGSDAIGGVMSFYTLQPKFSLTNNLFYSGNSALRFSSANNENTGHIDFNLGWNKFASITSITYSKFGDVKMGEFGPNKYLRNEYVKRINSVDIVVTNSNPLIQKPVDYNQINILQKLSFLLNDEIKFDYGFHYSTTSNYSRYDRLLRYRNDLPRSAEWYYGPQVWMMNNFNISLSKSNIFYDNLIFRTAHQKFEESRHDRDLNNNIRFDKFEEVDAYSINLDMNKKLTENSTIVYGIEEIYNNVKSYGKDTDINNNQSIKGASRYPQADWNSISAFIDYKNFLTNKIIFETGIRYSYFSLNADFDTTFYPFPFTSAKLNEGSFSGSFGFVYNPNNSTTMNINLSTGFRSPNVDDLGKVFDSEPGAVIVPNPNLIAEYAYNIDLGIAKVFNDFLKLDATGFYTFLDNAMVRRDFTINGLDSIIYSGEMSKVQALQNAANAYVWGIQAGIEFKLPKGFGFSANANYQKGEEVLDDGSKSPLRHAAPMFGSAHLTYSIKKIKMDFYGITNGEISFENLPEEEKGKDYIYAIDENGNPYSPSWYTLNLKLDYNILDNLNITGGIENITDQRYRPYSSGMVSAGRNFIFSIRCKL